MTPNEGEQYTLKSADMRKSKLDIRKFFNTLNSNDEKIDEKSNEMIDEKIDENVDAVDAVDAADLDNH